jgi:hypothetical protein
LYRTPTTVALQPEAATVRERANQDNTGGQLKKRFQKRLFNFEEPPVLHPNDDVTPAADRQEAGREALDSCKDNEWCAVIQILLQTVEAVTSEADQPSVIHTSGDICVSTDILKMFCPKIAWGLLQRLSPCP